MPHVNLVGKKFGRLSVVKFHGYFSPGKAQWLCNCTCGTKNKVVYGYNLKNGNSRSCGCMRIESTKISNSTHHKSRTPEYEIYCGILSRCFNKKNARYPLYGKRGIKVSQRWLGRKGFINFLEDVGYRPSSKHSIERIKNDKSYSPGNCCWATQKQQCRNKRTNRIVEYKGKRTCLKQLCEELEIPYSRTWWRLNAGWDIERVVE